MKRLFICETCGASFDTEQECDEHELACTPPTVEAYEVVLSYSQEEDQWTFFVHNWCYLMHEADFPYRVEPEECVEFAWRSRCPRTKEALEAKMQEMATVARVAVEKMDNSLFSINVRMPED